MKSFFFRVLIQFLISSRVDPRGNCENEGMSELRVVHFHGWKTEFSRTGLFFTGPLGGFGVCLSTE